MWMFFPMGILTSLSNTLRRTEIIIQDEIRLKLTARKPLKISLYAFINRFNWIA